MAALSRATGRPFSFNLQQISSLGDHYRRVIALAEAANRERSPAPPADDAAKCRGPLQLRSQHADRRPAVVRRARTTPARTAVSPHSGIRPCETGSIDEGSTKPESMFESMYLMPAGADARYAYSADDSLAETARRRGVTPVEAYLDAMVESGGRTVVNWPVMNSDEAAIEELITSPVTIMGLGDAGAHATQIMDASQPTYFLAHWCRDRGVVTLEEAVRALSHDTASFIGYADRGTLTPGSFADVNVIDLEASVSRFPRSSATSRAEHPGSSSVPGGSPTRS